MPAGDFDFASVVFAGGGSRCIWQVGFWQRVAPELGIRPRTVAAVSAGAAMACFIFSERVEEAVRSFSRRMADNPKNFYPSYLFHPTRPAFPQAAIYRASLLETFDDEAFARLRHDAPPIRILIARPPRWTGARRAALMGLMAYNLEKKLRYPLHPTWPRRLGFVPEIVSTRDCATREDLVDSILQSSCTPPFTPLYRREGKPVLDGGLIDNVPFDALPDEHDAGRTLVLLSRPYPQGMLRGHARRLYVCPSRPASVSTWDYTSPERLLETYETGRRDGEAFLRKADRAIAQAQQSHSPSSAQ